MSDALISPVVGGSLWAVSAATVGYCARKIREDQNPRLPALMGVMGAFVFAAQMINFAIPGTGSSGHIGGGILLAALLGPYGAFLTVASVLIVQALFFADGGLLALGCNLFNLGFLPCFVAFPLIYRSIAGNSSGPPSRQRLLWGSLAAAVIGLQLGALGVVLETVFSGVSDLTFGSFLLLMQPIHLAIGIGEGLATAALLIFLRQMEPSLLQQYSATEKKTSLKPALAVLALMALLTAGLFSRFASERPDGLEWAMEKSSDGVSLSENPVSPLHSSLEKAQGKTSFLPDYDFRNSGKESKSALSGTSIAGVTGGVITLCLLLLIGFSGRKKTSSP